MSLADRLVHSLAIVTPTVTAAVGDEDSWGEPVPGEPVVVYVNGLVQPKSAREVALSSQGGAVVATHVVFLVRQAVASSAYLRFEPDDGDRYEVTGVRDFVSGRSPHLEVDTRLVRSPELPLVAS